MMPRLGRLAWLLLLGLLLAPPARADVEIYRPRGRPPGELRDIAAGALGARGSAVADSASGSLVLRGDRAALDEVLSVLRRLDVVPVTFSVEARFVSLEEVRALGFDLGISGGRGAVAIGRRPRDGRAGVAVRLDSASGELRSRSVSRISVLEGRSAEIWTGSVHPVTRTQVWHRHPVGRRRGLTSTELVTVRRGFQVRANRSGEGEVELSIQPVYEDGDPAHGIRRVGAATSLRLRPGELVAIAGLDRSRDASSLGLGSAGQRIQSSEQVVLVRVDEL